MGWVPPYAYHTHTEHAQDTEMYKPSRPGTRLHKTVARKIISTLWGLSVFSLVKCCFCACEHNQNTKPDNTFYVKLYNFWGLTWGNAKPDTECIKIRVFERTPKCIKPNT